MGKNEKTPITVNGKEYFIEDLDDQQKTFVNHINDLSRKMDNAKFNFDQLAFGHQAFVNALAMSLGASEKQDEKAEALN